MPREALYLLKRIIQRNHRLRHRGGGGFPPYDVSDMTALMATRVICDTMAHLVVSEQLPRRQKPSYIHERRIWAWIRSGSEPCTKPT
jgi:agmatinase